MKKILLFSIVFLLAITVKAQEPLNPEIQQISPVTPNAAALGKFGNTPVSLYTGVPNIQVPIYEIKVKDFSLPISLNYHAGGVKVDDVASWAGMGWSLNAGGMITRKQRGVEDYKMINDKKFLYHYIETILNPISTDVEKNDSAFLLESARYDSESDIFSISTGTLSQKFFMDVDANIYTMPVRKLRIIPESRIYASQGRTYFGRWRITDERGIEYIFGKTLDDSKEEVEIFQSNQVCGATTDNPKTVSSWYLNEIILPSGESITFSYEYFSFCVENALSQTYLLDARKRFANKTATSYNKALRLKQISFPSGKIEFVPGDLRRDFYGTNTLEEIRIYAENSGVYDLIKSFTLETNNPDNNTTSGDDSFRLALISITENDKFGNTLEPYVFNYKNQAWDPKSFRLQPRGSYAQDIWGYNNGKTSNTGLIPNFLFTNENGQVDGDVNGADRSVDDYHAQAGILTKITYPTKGYTEFFYESNIAKGATDPSDPNSLNPLINLLNMDVRSTRNMYNGTQLENKNGSDVGYGETFEIFHETGVSVNFTSRIFYSDFDNECIKTTPISGGASFWECMDIILEKKNDSGVFKSANNTVYFDRNYTLFPGEYRVKLVWKDNSQIDSWGYVDLSWTDLEGVPSKEVDEHTEMLVGGLRISKIIDYDWTSTIELIRNYNYNYDESDFPLTGSSGFIQNVPLHLYAKNAEIPGGGICNFCVHLTSISNSPILQTGGGYVGYEKVTVSTGLIGGFGNTVSYFNSPRTFIDQNISASREWPFNKTTSLEWRRGLKTKAIENKYKLGQYLPVSTTNNIYTFNDNPLDINYKKLINVKIDRNIWGYTTITNPPSIVYNAKYSIYHTIGESFFQSQAMTTLHNSIGDISNTTNFYYDNPVHLQPTRIEAINSKGEKKITKTLYPDDLVDRTSLGLPYPDLFQRNAINKLKSSNQHQIAIPVQSITTVTDDNNSELSKTTSRTLFKDWDTDIGLSSDTDLILPEGVLTLKGTYESTNNPMENRISYHGYNTNGNPQEVSKTNGAHSYYIWGYQKQYPIAKIENFKSSDVSSSVQQEIDAAITASNEDNDRTRDYIGKEGELRQALKNLRDVLPADAMMSSYTYDPLIGVTSITDTRDYTIYYHYDNFNRLKEVKDADGHLVTDYEYHYKDQD